MTRGVARATEVGWPTPTPYLAHSPPLNSTFNFPEHAVGRARRMIFGNTETEKIVRNKAAEKAKQVGASSGHLNGGPSPQPTSNATSVIAHAPPAHETQRPSYSINGILGIPSQQHDPSSHKRKRDDAENYEENAVPSVSDSAAKARGRIEEEGEGKNILF
ncbi:paired box protein Pax-2a [Caerostris extrusa]|uniref:Paired box protein Pax-2a n=1 Tax=Caerostris extrusa TaxID=172846 RepID=A0AAV4TPP2_CAEEX|nr:paired box protein Pax-2a [Caerostris extrusa]